MNYRKYTNIFLLFCFTCIALVASFTFFMDPYWAFLHSHKFNNMQKGTNEREQKTNMIYFREFDHDALILGSSRTTLINQNDFKNFHAFNYAVSLVRPYEYNAYVEFAKKQNKKDFKTIIIGLDFFGTNQDVGDQAKLQKTFEETASLSYRYKSLLSIDALKIALNSFIRAITNKAYHRSYNRNNVATADFMDEKEITSVIKSISMDNTVGMKDYKFNDDYKNILQNLRSNNPNTNFIIFTTPVTAEYLTLFMKNNMLEDYKRWLRVSVEVFGEINHFMDFNTITNDYAKYFLDSNHVYPWVGTMIAERTLDIKNENIPKDFGKTLNSENIEQYIKEFQNSVISELKTEK